MHNSELARLEQTFNVECDSKPVKIGDWFVCSYGYDHPIGRCTQVLPNGLMLAFRWGPEIFPSQHFLEYRRILGRAQVGKLKQMFG